MEIQQMDLLKQKVEDSKTIIREAMDKYSVENSAIAWTGGKDSMFVLWLFREVAKMDGIEIPRCFCIDEGDMFDEVRDFLARYADDWNIDLEIIHNSDVSEAAGGKLGAPVRVADLNERNRREIGRLGYEEDVFDYEPESFVGNHLMKTVALNDYLERFQIQAFFEGIRWDEQESRANETYFSPRMKTDYSPEHMRVFPILHFLERELWEAHFAFGIPRCSLYEQGYRSLGARVTTTKVSDVPAWEQDLENTPERAGRRQDKEHLMKKLRELGYM